MRRVYSPIGSADEAQTLPASFPSSLAGSDGSCPLFLRPLPLFQRSLVRSRAWSRLERNAPTAALVEPDATIAMLVRALESTRHAALHDPLTGLANRSLILDHLHLALARAGRASTLVAVIFFDLDDFKQINDTLGHEVGDEVLVRVAARLGSAVRPSDTLGRWGGDEFVVVCEDLERPWDAAAIVDRITAGLESPFDVAGREIHVIASIGVALSDFTDRPAVLIAAADSAMYRAKRDRPARTPPGSDPPAWVPAALLSGNERITSRLRELLLSVEIDDDVPAAGR